LISRIRVGFENGTPGTYQCTDGSRQRRLDAAFEERLDVLLHEPQPVPARVASQSALSVRFPPRTEARISPLETPLQVADLRFVRRSRIPCGPAASAAGKRNRPDRRGSCAAIEGVQEARRRLGLAEQDGATSFPSRNDHLLVHAALLVDVLDLLVFSGDRLARTHHGEVDAHYF